MAIAAFIFYKEDSFWWTLSLPCFSDRKYPITVKEHPTIVKEYLITVKEYPTTAEEYPTTVKEYLITVKEYPTTVKEYLITAEFKNNTPLPAEFFDLIH